MSDVSAPPEIVTIRIPSRLDLLSVLDSVATALCDRMNFDPDTTSQVTMSVIEAGTNAIQHGHRRNAALPIDVRFQLLPDRLEIDVTDSGPGFDVERINGDITSPEHILDARGRGMFILRACMDSVEFDFLPSGTVCRLVKLRPPQAAAS